MYKPSEFLSKDSWHLTITCKFSSYCLFTYMLRLSFMSLIFKIFEELLQPHKTNMFCVLDPTSFPSYGPVAAPSKVPTQCLDISSQPLCRVTSSPNLDGGHTIYVMWDVFPRGSLFRASNFALLLRIMWALYEYCALDDSKLPSHFVAQLRWTRWVSNLHIARARDSHKKYETWLSKGI